MRRRRQEEEELIDQILLLSLQLGSRSGEGRALLAPSVADSLQRLDNIQSAAKEGVAQGEYGSKKPEANATSAFDSFSPLVHHSNEEVARVLRATHAACPNHTRLYELSERSLGGWPLLVLAFEQEPRDALTPRARLVANIHGNEVLGRELLLHLATWLCRVARHDSSMSAEEAELAREMHVPLLLQQTGIHLLVSMNPDGWEVATRALADGANGDSGANSEVLVSEGVVGRFNLNGVDLNRDFPDVLTLGSDVTSADHELQPETRAVLDWITRTPAFVLSASLHGGSLVANYPYDQSPAAATTPGGATAAAATATYAPTPDDDTFRALALTYARNHESMWRSRGCGSDDERRFDGGVTNGAAWYPVAGGMQDFAYLATNAFELTLETGCDKYPAADQLEREWRANRRALLSLLWQSHAGIKGIVSSASGKKPLAARVSVHNVTSGRNQIIDHSVWSDGASGAYFRLLTPGVYEVTADAGPAFLPATKLVSVPRARHSPATRIDFDLEAAAAPVNAHARVPFAAAAAGGSEVGLEEEDPREEGGDEGDAEEEGSRVGSPASYDFSNPELLEFAERLARHSNQLLQVQDDDSNDAAAAAPDLLPFM